jgi:REP element-mobilizing transposase RayT
MCRDGCPATAGRHPDTPKFMAANWKNYYTDNAVHHITGTVYKWQPVLLCNDILSIFSYEFNRLLAKWDVELIGYVLMPEHFHMLAKSHLAENILNFIRGGRRSVSGKVRWSIENNNRKISAFYENLDIDPEIFYSGTGGKSKFRFWKEKPRIFPISKEIDLEKKLKYIHNNPVRRGLVKSPEEWEYSSYKSYRDREKIRLPLCNKYQDVIHL